MDYRTLVNRLEAISNSTSLSEASAPTVFKPTHFHKGNLGNKNPVMQAPDGSWWWETSGNPETGQGGTIIAPWQGNTENRSGWNPASIDGVITPDGKYIEFPEGVSWKQYKEKQDSDAGAALLAKLKQLIELVDKYMALKAKRGGQGARPASGPTTQDIGDGSKLTVDPKTGATAATNDDGTPYIPGSNPNLPKNKVGESVEFKGSIAKNLVESFGYESSVDEVAIPAGAAAAGGAASKLLGKAMPGVGAVLGAQGAYDSYKKGDYLGAALNGLSGAFSLVPGLGWVPALGFGAWQAGRELSGATDKFNAPADQGAKPTEKGDPKVLAIQKKILAKDPKALPQHGADGMMGPETQAAMARLKIQESTEMTQPKSLAESIKELQQRLMAIESEIQPGEETNEFINSDNDTQANEESEAQPASAEEQALGSEISQAGGKFFKHPNGNEYIVLPDGKTVVNAATQEIVDASTEAMTPTGQKIDPSQISESMGLDEGVWDSILKGAAKLAPKLSQGVKTGFTKGALSAGTAARAGVANKAGNLIGRSAKGVSNVGKTIAKNPVKSALGIGAAGLAGGYMAGKMGSGDAPTAPTGQGGSSGGSSGQGGSPTTPSVPQEDDAEMKALRAQIDALIKDLSSSQDPAIQKGLADVQAKLK